MSKLKKKSLPTGVALALGSLFACAGAAGAFAAPAQAATYEGKPVKIGHGTARVVVHTNRANQPVSVAVEFSPGLLDGLPASLNEANTEGAWEYRLPMPVKGPKTGYSHVAIDWNLHGHPPPHVYTVPHFDFHFYAMSEADVEKVHFTGPSDPATQVADSRLIPADYKVIPDTAVNKMGVHSIDLTSQEFHGKPFTATFIYGYYKGALTFVEPMVTRAYLLQKPNFTAPVKTPARYSTSGYYPTRYTVRYDAAHKKYVVELGDLKSWSETASGN